MGSTGWASSNEHLYTVVAVEMQEFESAFHSIEFIYFCKCGRNPQFARARIFIFLFGYMNTFGVCVFTALRYHINKYK